MNKWNWAGGVVSVGWLAYMGFLLWPQCSWLSCEEINEVGDFFAGAFAPLAFLWLVLGYRQQGEELKQNREALLLQAEELKNSVVQQEAMVRTSVEQLALDKRNWLQEREGHIRPAQPVFELTGASSDERDNSVYFAFELRNHGATVKRLRVSRFDEERSIINVQELSGGSAIDSGLTLSKYWRGSEPTVIELQVSYLDAFGEDRTAVMRLQIEAVGDSGRGKLVNTGVTYSWKAQFREGVELS